MNDTLIHAADLLFLVGVLEQLPGKVFQMGLSHHLASNGLVSLELLLDRFQRAKQSRDELSSFRTIFVDVEGLIDGVEEACNDFRMSELSKTELTPVIYNRIA